MIFAKVIRGVEVDIEGHDYEHSPDIGISGYEYVTATDMDGKSFDLTEEEQEQLCIEASQIKYDEPLYFEGDGWETEYD